jgi:hypothetical protein
MDPFSAALSATIRGPQPGAKLIEIWQDASGQWRVRASHELPPAARRALDDLIAALQQSRLD